MGSCKITTQDQVHLIGSVLIKAPGVIHIYQPRESRVIQLRSEQKMQLMKFSPDENIVCANILEG